jgi:hypothetical protein
MENEVSILLTASVVELNCYDAVRFRILKKMILVGLVEPPRPPKLQLPLKGTVSREKRVF